MNTFLKSGRYAISALLLTGFVLATPATAGYEKVSYGKDVPSTAAISAQGHKLALQYDIYAGGFKALNASLKMDMNKKAYDIAMEAETQGFIGSLFPWKGSFNTAGHTSTAGTLIPTLHTERSSWRQKVSITEMSYDPSGKVLKTTSGDTGHTTTNRDIDAVLSAHAADMLTSTLALLQNAQNSNKCTGVFPVFDGKRRYNITLTDDGTEVLPQSKYSRFSGEAMRCTLKVDPVAGFGKNDGKRGWMAVQNHTEEHHKLPTLWLAHIKGSDQIVPVRMEIASEYGSVVAHLSKGIEN